MVAGLTVQAATLLGFTTVSIDFGMRTYRRYRRQGPSTLEQSPEMVELRNSRRFKGFLVALGLSTMLIFWRSVFRVVELSEGWQGDLIRNQELFVAFEGVLILVAVMVLNVFHPAFCFTDIFTRKMDSKGNLSSDEEMGRGRTGKPVRSAQWDKEVERKRMERLSREWAKELEVGYGDWRQVKSAEWKAARIRGEEWDKEVDGGYEYPRQVKSKSQLPISETGRTKADREGAMKVKSAKVDSEAERRKQERKSAEWVKEMEMGYRNPVKSTEVKREVQPPRTKVTSTEWDNLDELGVVDTKALNRFSLGEQRVRPKDAYYAKR